MHGSQRVVHDPNAVARHCNHVRFASVKAAHWEAHQTLSLKSIKGTVSTSETKALLMISAHLFGTLRRQAVSGTETACLTVLDVAHGSIEIPKPDPSATIGDQFVHLHACQCGMEAPGVGLEGDSVKSGQGAEVSNPKKAVRRLCQ